MPKPTFFNLPDDKRQTLIDIAIEEFANNPYKSVSISRIVSRAGIAKGSFYQYFEDKHDLYMFLLEEGARIKRQFMLAHPPPDPNMDLFAYLRWLMKAGLRYEYTHSNLARIAYQALNGQGEFPREWLEQSNQMFRALIERSIAAGQLRADLNADIASYVFQATMRDFSKHLMERLGYAPGDDNLPDMFASHQQEVEQIFDQLLAVLEHGMSGKASS